jgi:hypothetical protein
MAVALFNLLAAAFNMAVWWKTGGSLPLFCGGLSAGVFLMALSAGI